MRLKEKTHRKFVEFFKKISNMYQGKEFELAYSDIQRETGAASVTLKRAIKALVDDGIIEVAPGRNSRYARFRYLLTSSEEKQGPSDRQNTFGNLNNEEIVQAEGNLDALNEEISEISKIVDHLWRRMRNQEMSISLLQDRLAELEDKLRKR